MATTPRGERCEEEEEETRRIEELTRWRNDWWEKETAASSLGQMRRRPEKEGAEGWVPPEMWAVREVAIAGEEREREGRVAWRVVSGKGDRDETVTLSLKAKEIEGDEGWCGAALFLTQKGNFVFLAKTQSGSKGFTRVYTSDSHALQSRRLSRCQNPNHYGTVEEKRYIRVRT